MRAETMPALAGRPRSATIRCAGLALAVWASFGIPASAADPDVLWQIVSQKCVPNQQQRHAPAPCEKVDLTRGVERGFAVLKDIDGDTQFLLIPTARVPGIESPALLMPDAPNYWTPAWAARRNVLARAHRGLPRDAIGLAVNSAKGRSQNQLHIHVDCVRPDLRRYLARHPVRLARRWSPLDVAFDGHHYLARRLDSRDLHGVDPFKVLARDNPAARADMGNWTLVAVGAKQGGFVLLAGHVDPATHDDASGDELLDHSCALARSPAGGR
jgi:CDP-diacylglycerol pyrophosphatase